MTCTSNMSTLLKSRGLVNYEKRSYRNQNVLANIQRMFQKLMLFMSLIEADTCFHISEFHNVLVIYHLPFSGKFRFIHSDILNPLWMGNLVRTSIH